MQIWQREENLDGIHINGYNTLVSTKWLLREEHLIKASSNLKRIPTESLVRRRRSIRECLAWQMTMEIKAISLMDDYTSKTFRILIAHCSVNEATKANKLSGDKSSVTMAARREIMLCRVTV